MLKNDLILRNPLRLVGQGTGHCLSEGGFGAVVAQAGVGKTSLLVQLALDSLLRGKNVLHISLDQPVKKVCLWYEEVFRHIAEQYRLSQTAGLWDAILPHRFIMTFNVEAFSCPKLDERLTDLIEQGIFFPQVVLVDGLPFDGTAREPLTELKLLARGHGMRVWFTARSAQGDGRGEGGAPGLGPLHAVADLFEVIIELQPVGQDIYVRALKGGTGEEGPVILDPASLLIKDSG